MEPVAACLRQLTFIVLCRSGDDLPGRKVRMGSQQGLGKAVLNRKVGSEFSDGSRQYKLIAVRPLSPEIVAELDA